MSDAQARVPTRDEIRAKIFSGENKPRSVLIDFFGAKIEIRQLPVHDMHLLAGSGASGADEQEAIVRILVNMSYVPGTNDRVFEAADYDSIKKMPYGPDMNRVAEALRELTQVNLPNGSGG